MHYSHLLTVQQEAKMSPEQLAKRLGVSGMSLRRWRLQRPRSPLPKLYANALSGVVLELMAEGRLSVDSAIVREALRKTHQSTFHAIISHLGIGWDQLRSGRYNLRKLLESLSFMGATPAHQKDVHAQAQSISLFKRWSPEWASRITTLWDVVRSKKLTVIDKLVAYGALFYLITPFDLIPDATPIFGYMDDYLILGMAATFYLKRASKKRA